MPAERSKWCHSCNAVVEQVWLPKNQKYIHEECLTLNDGTCPAAESDAVRQEQGYQAIKADKERNRKRMFPQYSRTQSRHRVVRSRSATINKHRRSKYTGVRYYGSGPGRSAPYHGG